MRTRSTQKSHPFIVLSLGAAALIAAALAGCGKSDKSDPAPQAAAQPRPPAPQPVPQPVPPPPAPPAVSPLAEAVESFDFRYEPMSHRMSVYLDYFNPDVPAGSIVRDSTSLYVEGGLDANGQGTLTTPQNDWVIQVHCRDAFCNEVDFDLERRLSTHNGHLVIRQRAIQDIPVRVREGDSWSFGYLAADIAREVRAGNLKSTLYLREIVGTRRTFFKLELEDFGWGYRDEYDRYQRGKAISISGSEGRARTLWLNRSKRGGRWNTENYEAQTADVRIDTQNVGLWIRFRENRGLLGLVAGAMAGGFPAFDGTPGDMGPGYPGDGHPYDGHAH